MDDTVNLRVKCRSGHHVISRLPLALSVAELKERLAALTGVPAPAIRLLHGYPPVSLNLPDPSASLATLALHSGDTLIVEQNAEPGASAAENGCERLPGGTEKPGGKIFGGGMSAGAASTGGISGSLEGGSESAIAAKAPNVNLNPSQPSSHTERDRQEDKQQNRQTDTERGGGQQGILMRKMVPPNNSCLFTALDYVLNSGRGGVNLDSAPPMRRLVARVVSEQREVYSAVVLGRENAAYCAWILDSKSWGGAIEVSILAAHHRVEIDVIDALSGIVSRFGEADHYPERVFLFYDGTHYDPVALEDPFASSSAPRTRFPTSDLAPLAQAREMASEARASRQYTDLEAGMCRCGDCGVLLKGEAALLAHGKETGHARFSEV